MVTGPPPRIIVRQASTMATWVRRFWLTRPLSLSVATLHVPPRSMCNLSLVMIVNLHKSCLSGTVMRVNSHEGGRPMTQVSVIGPADGEVIHLGTTQMRILEDGRTTEHRVGVGEAILAPHTDGPLQHRHAQHDEGFYVV